MKRIINILFSKKQLASCFLLLNLLFIVCPLNANIDESLKQQEDSLLSILSKTYNPAHKISTLRDLVTLNQHTPKEAYYAKQMLETAIKIDSIPSRYEAIFHLNRYYCNTYQLDSLRYWVHILDSITTARNEAPKELLLSHSALCRLYLIRGEHEAAMNEAVKQQIIAGKTNDQLGFAYCNEYWGLIYLFTSRFEESALALENCISILASMKDQYTYYLQVSDNLLRVYMYLKEYTKAEKVLDDYEQTIAKIEASDSIKYRTARKTDYHAMLESFRIWLYAEMQMQKKSEEARKRLALYESSLSKPYIATIFHIGMASYYYAIKDYPNAFIYINSKPIDHDILFYQLKVAILKALGKEREVLETYQQYLDYEISRRKLSYTRQIDQLQSLQNLKDEEQALQDFAVQEKELQNRHSQLIALIILSFTLLLSLLFWIWNLLQTKKLKNDLEKEQSALKKIYFDLQIAKEKAEKAEKMKSNFVTNISHEIRMPLNSIVDFTNMLKDSDKKERTEYIHSINNNSDLLLTLVNDVLDLSHLENEDFTSNTQSVKQLPNVLPDI